MQRDEVRLRAAECCADGSAAADDPESQRVAELCEGPSPALREPFDLSGACHQRLSRDPHVRQVPEQVRHHPVQAAGLLVVPTHADMQAG